MKQLRNDKGLTLLEVMISMIILAIGILGLAPLVVLSIDGNNISRDVMMASTMAKDKMEIFENMAVLPPLPYQEYESDVDSSGYSRITVIKENLADTTLPPGVSYMNVTIRWQDNKGKTKSTTYSTILQKD